MDNILDHVVVQGQRYDIVSPTAFGDNIETIGSACINPDGYAQGSTFLARLGNEQFYYEATAAITQGSSILEGTNCKKTTVTGREAELASEIETLGETVDSLNEALTNEVTTRATLGAHNLLPITAVTQVINEATFTINSDGSVTTAINGTLSEDTQLYLLKVTDGKVLDDVPFILSGCPSGGSASTYYLEVVNRINNVTQILGKDTGNEFGFDADGYPVGVRIVLKAGQTGTKTWYPMIRLASDTDTTYQSYAMTNRELTDNVVVKNVTITPKPGVTISYNGSHKIGNLAILNFVFLLDASFLIANDAPIVTIDTPPLDNAILVPSAMLWDGEVGGLLGIMKTNNIIKLATSSHFVAGKSYTVNATYVCA